MGRSNVSRVQGIAFLVICSLLVGWNALVIVRNQRTFGSDDVIKRRPGDIARIASQNSMNVVKTTFAAYYHLRILAGKRLDISNVFAAHRFAFERVSRIDVRVLDEVLYLPRSASEDLFSSFQHWWALEQGTPLAVLTVPGVTHYVLVQREGRGFDMIMPMEVYQAAVASSEGAAQ